jgi:hypothetical protein
MNASRIFYRTRQFWQALGASLSPEDLDLVHEVLAPSQRRLFEQLQMSERVHSIKVLRALLDRGEDHPDLLLAALLHDVGKSRFPLNLLDRILIVLGKAFFPQRAKRWGSEPVSDLKSLRSYDRPGLLVETFLKIWRRPFIIAERHPAWGAEMAARSGASPLAVALIRRHQDELDPGPGSNPGIEQHLLRKLQAVDDNS